MLLSKIVLPCLHVPAVLSCAALGWPGLVWAGLCFAGLFSVHFCVTLYTESLHGLLNM